VIKVVAHSHRYYNIMRLRPSADRRRPFDFRWLARIRFMRTSAAGLASSPRYPSSFCLSWTYSMILIYCGANKVNIVLWFGFLFVLPRNLYFYRQLVPGTRFEIIIKRANHNIISAIGMSPHQTGPDLRYLWLKHKKAFIRNKTH